MDSIPIHGHVDHQHRLVAEVPSAIPPGPVTVWIVPTVAEDEAGAAWANGVVAAWSDDLDDPRQDIYSPDDGEPVDPA